MSTKSLRSVLEKDAGPVTFAMFLRVARDSLGLSQAGMSRKLGIARGTLCDLEKGRQIVSVKLAIKVARKAGLSPVIAVQACLQDQVLKAGLSGRVALIA